MTQPYATYKKSPSNVIMSVGKRIQCNNVGRENDVGRQKDILANTHPKQAGVAVTLDK